MPPIVQQKSKQISNSIQMPQGKQEEPRTDGFSRTQNTQAPKLTSRQKKVLSGLQEEIVKLAEETKAFEQGVEKELAAMQKPGADPTDFIRSIAFVNNGRARQYEKQYELAKASMKFQNLEFTQECEDRFRVSVLEGRIRLLKVYEREPYSRYAELLKDLSSLRESLESELEGLQKKLTLRQELKKSAKTIADKAHVYQESGFQEACNSVPEQELLRMYLDYADKLWDTKTRKENLSAVYITEHIVQSLTVLEVGKAFQMKRAGLKLTQEEQEQLARADQIFQYYRQHVDTVLGDYGMSLDRLSYSGEAVENLVSRKHALQQSDRWSEDYEAYHRLLGIREEPDTDEETMPAGERRLRSLERRAGIIVNDSEGMTASVYDKDTGAQLLESRQRDAKSCVRLKKDILTTTAERRRAFSREQRLLAVSKVFITKLKQDKVWSPDSPFNEIPNLLMKEIFSYDSDEKPSYVKAQMKLLQELTEKLNQILLTSPVFRERQFAAVLLQYLSEEQNGELVKQKGDAEYRAEDRNYVGMNKVREDEKTLDKQGKPKKYIETFESVRDEPLFAHDPVLKDLEQGYIGNCYFIASLASLVARDPGAIKRMMKDNGDGTVTVRFYDKSVDDIGMSGTPEGICVTVDKTIPIRTWQDTKFCYTPYSRGALWVKMMEKAYAAVRVKSSGEIVVRRKGAPIDYMNIKSGLANVAMMHLTGEDMIGRKVLYDRREVQTFDGRLQSDVDMSQADRKLIDQKRLKRPGNLYFYQQHRNEQDKAACRYLAGKPVSAQLAAGYKQELQRYQTVEKWLEALLEEQEGKGKLGLMDTSLFVEAIARQISYLRTSLGALRDYNGMELTDEVLRRAGFTKKWDSVIRGCWKVCDKNADTLLATAEGMLGAFGGEMMKDRQRNEYTAQEEKLYLRFRDVLKRGGSCFFGTRVFPKKGSDGSGNAGEVGQDGIYGNHAYAIIGTEEHQVGNRVKKFLRVFNPHGAGIPLYQLDERNNLKRVGFKVTEENEKQYSDATHGVFLLELRDLYSVMSDISTSKLPASTYVY